ncbi:NAD-dependent epimerase/dehydratase family protein [Carboxydothermus islandicus]|uniref:NAD-dependent epimerase/dehydratase family protein n=1 Tax=Carboxydothermus islandicus TaxID=661089 RepID=UPI001177E305
MIITGATGFICQVLTKPFVTAGYEVMALSRNTDKGRKICGEIRLEDVVWAIVFYPNCQFLS